jgi:endoribonuclease Dicer
MTDPTFAESAEIDQVEFSSDSDTENPDLTPAAQVEAEKNQARQAAFDEFLNITAGKLEALANADTKRRNHESQSIINQARNYQQELFELAKESNVIAVLDTGSGKTLIACLLMKWMAQQELIDRANGKKPRVAFFLANSVRAAHDFSRPH